MKPIVWSKDWTLGHELIDAQHKHLISILNKMILGESEFEELLEDLVDYTGYHFADEERLMFDNHYPEELYKAHKEEHKGFVSLLLEISFGNGSYEVVKDFNEVCLDWFRLHFLGTDKLLADFLQGGANTDNKPNN